MTERVNHPAHYNTGTIEVIAAIEDWRLDFTEGCVVKYVARWRHKDGIQDLKKALWYLNHLIEREEEKCRKQAAEAPDEKSSLKNSDGESSRS
jgi:hypothetical protein